MITSASHLVAHFRHSSIATAALYKQQEKMNLPRKKLMLHSKTRWNSAFDMLQRLRENRWAVSAVLADPAITKSTKGKSLKIANDEWRIINSICPALYPIKLATVMLSADENVSIFIVLPTVAGLLDKSVTPDDDPDEVRLFKEEFQNQLSSRFKLDVADRKSLTILHNATFHDPRFAYMSFVNVATRHSSSRICASRFPGLNPSQQLMQCYQP